MSGCTFSHQLLLMFYTGKIISMRKKEFNILILKTQTVDCRLYNQGKMQTADWTFEVYVVLLPLSRANHQQGHLG